MNIIYIVVFLYLILIITSNKRYIYLLPTIMIYPNNNNEINEVNDKVLERTQQDIMFFNKTDPSVSYAFLDETDLTFQQLEELFLPYNYIIYFFKYSINRARPYQINNKLKILYSKTGDTPSYPSGHAFQAYLLYKKLSKRHPEKKIILHYCKKMR